MKKIVSMLLTLLLLCAFCSCELPWKKDDVADGAESTDTSAPTNEESDTTKKPDTETAPSTMGTGAELSDENMPSMDWSEGEDQ